MRKYYVKIRCAKCVRGSGRKGKGTILYYALHGALPEHARGWQFTERRTAPRILTPDERQEYEDARRRLEMQRTHAEQAEMQARAAEHQERADQRRQLQRRGTGTLPSAAWQLARRTDKTKHRPWDEPRDREPHTAPITLVCDEHDPQYRIEFSQRATLIQLAIDAVNAGENSVLVSQESARHF